MFAFTNSSEKNSPSIIGAGCRFVGDINTDNTLQIHGIVSGKINAKTVVIGLGGQVVGRIVAQELFLHGDMQGPVTVDTANIFSSATMTGQLSYVKLNIHNNDGLECKLNKRKSSNETEE